MENDPSHLINNIKPQKRREKNPFIDYFAIQHDPNDNILMKFSTIFADITLGGMHSVENLPNIYEYVMDENLDTTVKTLNDKWEQWKKERDFWTKWDELIDHFSVQHDEDDNIFMKLATIFADMALEGMDLIETTADTLNDVLNELKNNTTNEVHVVNVQVNPENVVGSWFVTYTSPWDTAFYEYEISKSTEVEGTYILHDKSAEDFHTNWKKNHVDDLNWNIDTVLTWSNDRFVGTKEYQRNDEVTKIPLQIVWEENNLWMLSGEGAKKTRRLLHAQSQATDKLKKFFAELKVKAQNFRNYVRKNKDRDETKKTSAKTSSNDRLKESLLDKIKTKTATKKIITE